MKRLNNILSYLWSLLLFLTLTTCSDWEEIVVTMQMEEEVELTIQTEISGMKGSTRAQMEIAEAINTIVAIAFDESNALIKKVDATLTKTTDTSGTLKIKVPKRTRTIHFLGNYTKENITSITTLDELRALTTNDVSTMHYWGKATFDGTNATLPVTLYRNMAKVTLEAGNDDYIAGFLNYNSQGTLVPSEFTLGTINAVSSLDSHDDDNELGTEHYLFEHANEKNNNPLYAICNIGGKYYKIAFAYTNNGSVTYFDIIRNNAYKIVISDIDELYGEDSFENAQNENTQPINDLVIAEGDPLTITADPAELPTTQGGICYVTVAIPQGITELMVDADAVFTVTSADVTLTDGKCDVNGKETVTFTLTVNANATTGDKKVSFSGRGKYMTATGSTTIRLYENATLSISPTSVYNTAGSTTTVSVPIPQGITSLTATSEAFTVTSNEVSLNNGSFDVSGKQGQSVTFTLTLKDGGVGTVDDTRTVTFAGTDGNYKRAMGTATVTLAEAPAQGSLPVYELWFEENNGWNGSNGYATFFTKNGDITTGNGNASNMESTFYDGTFTVNDVTYSGADNHRSYAMTMGDGKSIGFTITEPCYLTLLVASSGNTPSINLSGSLSEGSWATESSSAAVVPTNYNFGNGEIGTNGRLICYTLPAGTYTLQRESNDYLLYYMRVSTTKPTMTDIVQPTVSDYALSWSGGEWGNWTYVENGNLYVVDDDAKTFTLTYTGLGLTEGTLTLNNSTLTIPHAYDNNQYNTYSISGNTCEITNVNVGTYSYTIGSGEITAPVYKYSNFYDKIALKAVANSNSVTVKNSVKLKLTNDEIYQHPENVVDYYDLTLTDPCLAICTPETRINTGRAFTFTITENWTYREDTNKTLNNGISMMSQAGNTFTIAQGQETSDDQTWEHPFWPTYIYYLDWGDFTDTSNTNRALSTMTIVTDDADIWFSYKGKEISKSMVINVNQNPGDVVEPEGLDIALDFYSAENRDNSVYEDLLLGTSHLYLTATISAEDAAKYAGQNVTVTLNGEFGITQGQGKWSINWDGSRNAENSSIGSNISSSSNAFQLSFTIGYDNEGNPQTEYLIEWVFKTGQYYNAGEAIGFTYNISNYTISNVDGTFNNFTGDTSATIGFTNEPIGLEIYSEADTDGGAGITIASGDELVMKAIVPSDITTGTITFDLSGSTGDITSGITWNDRAGQSVQFSWPNITLTVVENQRDYYLYWNPTVSDERSATLNFTVSGNYNLNSVGNTSYSKAITVTTGTVVWTGSTALNWESTPINVFHFLPMGTKVTLNFTATANASIELHDSSRDSFRLLGANHPENDDDYISIEAGQTSISFTVNNETISGLNDFANGLNGLIIMGSSDITMTSIVVQYPNKTGQIFSYDFSDNQTINGWGENGKNNVSRSIGNENGNNYLILSNTGGFAQAAIDGEYEPGNYTLTFKVRGTASGYMNMIFQHHYDPSDTDPVYDETVGNSNPNPVGFTTEWPGQLVEVNITLNKGANRFLINYTDFTGDIHIDDLKLVRNQ